MAKQRIFYGLDYYDLPRDKRPPVCAFGVYDAAQGRFYVQYYTAAGRPLMCIQRGAGDFELIANITRPVAPSKQAMRKRLNALADKGAQTITIDGDDKRITVTETTGDPDDAPRVIFDC